MGSQVSLEDHLARFVDVWERLKTPKDISQPLDSAQVVYMRTLFDLLHLWHSEPPVNPALGNIAACWCEQHKGIFEIIQHGVFSRRRSLSLERGKDGLLAFVATDFLTPAVNFEAQAKTLAYVQFGDFLTGEPERLRLCGFCEKPFLKRAQKWKFCSLECAHRDANEHSRLQNLSSKECKRLRTADRYLQRWISKPSHRAKANWRKELRENTGLADEYGFQTKDGRLSRTLARYIRAAATPPESPERTSLLKRLKCGTQRPDELAKLQQDFDRFLKNIQRAEQISKGGKE